MPGFTDPVALIREIEVRYPLPSIAGGKATWTCRINGESVGIFAQQWSTPKAAVASVSLSETNDVHFKYHAQVSPDAVL